ncbi:hypothetical protein RND81_14G091200 [Saponaria officinalis]|uniref:Nudix hydrolase domain-containing protein n=1 Tax=Saponaria officinalis TaxID=3572 RepID=A0AAW1GMI0_SAPOF
MPLQPPQPPHQPPKLHHHHNNHHPTSQNLPDFLVTTISLLLFITAPKHHLSPFPPPHRRFIPTAITMSQNPRNPKNPRNPNNPNFNSSSFPTPQSLSNWLKPRLPSDSFSTWGISPGTKNIHNLWLELVDGETSLIDSIPPLRNLEVVCVRVRNANNLILIENHQELSDGSIRKRGRPLSEKMKSGEDVESSAKRAVFEELGSVLNEVNDENVKILFDSYERKVEERSSVSYPGLPACYVLHYVDAFVEGLPEAEFVTEEGDEYDDDRGVASEAVKVKRHFWKWVSDDSV